MSPEARQSKACEDFFLFSLQATGPMADDGECL
jgi:hypothetical protein